MGFSLLAPAFLAGLAALIVPIFIHLTHRERKDVVAFPSLMFLRRIPYRTVRRQRIRHWLLFLMRTAAIVLLVAAFTRPLFHGSTAAVEAFTSAREVVLLLDRSYSMGYGERWSRAVDAARRVIDGLGPEDRATLVLFDEHAVAVTQRTADRFILHGAIDAGVRGYGITRYTPAIELAREIAERSDRPRSEVILITDFQRAGWDARTAVRLPDGAAFVTIDVAEPDPINLAVTDASLSRSRPGGEERVVVSARVANTGSGSFDEIPVTLEIDGEEIQSRRVSLGPSASETVRFAAVKVSDRPMRGVVRAGRDPLPDDNSFHFVIRPEDPLSVLIVEPRGAQSDHSLYLRRALGIRSRPGFDVQVRRVNQLRPAHLDGASVIILNDAPFPTGAAAQRLRSSIEEGVGLLVVLGRRTSIGAWPAEAADLLPARYGAPVDRSSDGGATVNYLDYDHPVFELFRAPRSGDFTPARFFRYRRFESAGAARVLARFDDGSIAAAELRDGAGRVLFLTSDLQNFWNDLALQPVFLPFVHQAVRYLSGYVESDAWSRVGEVIDLSRIGGQVDGAQEPADASDERIIESPSGERAALRAAEASRYVELEEPGFYSIRYVGEGVDRGYALAANLDLSESDLTALDPEELTGAVAARGEVERLPVEALLTPQERERRQGLWWYLLVGAALFLLAETVVSNRRSAT